MRYHHVGIPTRERRPGERYLPALGMWVSGFEDSPWGVEWMRFEPGCQLPELVQTVPHVAFEVDDLEAALVGREVLIEPNAPSPVRLLVGPVAAELHLSLAVLAGIAICRWEQGPDSP